MANKLDLLKLDKLPLQLLGFRNMPAVPLASIGELLGTLFKLGIRTEELKQASQGLNVVYTIDGITAPAYPFLFGESGAGDSNADDSGTEDSSSDDSDLGSKLVDGLKNFVSDIEDKLEGRGSDETEIDERYEEVNPADSAAPYRDKLESLLKDDSFDVVKYLEEKVANDSAQPIVEEASTSSMNAPSLDAPEQFSMSWTTFGQVYRDALPHLETWAATLTDVDTANEQFFPTLAEFGLAYNLLLTKKVDAEALDALKEKFGDGWDQEMTGLAEKGLLYLIDLSIFETVQVQKVDDTVRFTPATLTLLRQNPETKALTPIAVRVSGYEGSDAQVYLHGVAKDGAWLYALQAAKTSVSVYGIWIGHVYHWHIVSAAMQMTLFNTIPEDHPLYSLLSPQSNYLIAFDEILLILWEGIAPPTSITSAGQFLDLMNNFADGREYFDDDPTTTLANLGVTQKDFTVDKPWDQYPIVGYLLEVWGATEAYVEAFVLNTYDSDSAVADDENLQKWIKQSGSRFEGNVKGLPDVETREQLTRVLTSLIYRITVHGNGRLIPTAQPALTFVANFPPCLQDSTIFAPTDDVSTEQLLQVLPNTGTIGKVITFFYTFLYSVPYQSFVPLDGINTNLFFPNGLEDPRNRALVAYRQAIIDFMKVYEDGSPQVNQWPLNIET